MYRNTNLSQINEEDFFAGAVPAFKWRGEVDCIVGPFKTDAVARFFFDYLITDNHNLDYENCLLKNGDDWYLNLCS